MFRSSSSASPYSTPLSDSPSASRHTWHTFLRVAPTFWYRSNFVNAVITNLLKPFSWLYRLIILIRRSCYRYGILRTYHFSIPIVVVGNITVGGTGKTPLVIWLANFLTQRGYKVGIVSRGYGKKTRGLQVIANDTGDSVGSNGVVSGCAARAGSNAVNVARAVKVGNATNRVLAVGDEAWLIAHRTNCPMVVGENRVAAVAKLLAMSPSCDVVISDDGLQHYALGRTLEIALVNDVQNFGNGCCLPAGPLRESLSRLRSVDFVVRAERVVRTAHASNSNAARENGGYVMQIKPQCFYRVRDIYTSAAASHALPITALSAACLSRTSKMGGGNKIVHAIAGIGNPAQFFHMLRDLGLCIQEHIFPDHHIYSTSDFAFLNADTNISDDAGGASDDMPLIMTEKDAVKCSVFAAQYNKNNWWYLHVNASVNDAFKQDFWHALLNKKTVKENRKCA